MEPARQYTLGGLANCYRLLDSRQRRDYWIVALLATLAALMEMVGIAAIIPVISVLVDYEGSLSNAYLQGLFEMLGHPSRETLLVVLALSAVAAVWFSGLVSLLSIYARQRYFKRISADLAARVYRRYMTYPIEAFYGRASSEFMRNVNGISGHVANGVIGASIAVIARFVQILVVTSLLFVINAQVTSIILLVIGGSYLAIYMLVRKRVVQMSTQNLAEIRTLQQLVIGSYQAYRSIVIDQQLDSLVSHFRKLKHATARKAANIEIIGSTPRQLIEMIGITLLILASFVIGQTAQAGHQFVAMMALFGIAAYRILPSAQQLYNAFNRINASLAVYRVVAEDWGDLRDAPLEQAASPRLTKGASVLEVRDLSYAFKDKELFNGLSVSLGLSGVIRIAGESGRGKSTFIELLAGLRKPQHGEILLDGATLSGERLLHWWSDISYVSQSDYVYEGTIRENIVLDRPVDEARLARVAEICGLKQLSGNGAFTADQDISEAGTNLSGGERSRVLLARALYKSANVIFLDEAFAALDVATARDIISSIRNHFPDRCLVIVSHREAELPNPFHTICLDVHSHSEKRRARA